MGLRKAAALLAAAVFVVSGAGCGFGGQATGGSESSASSGGSGSDAVSAARGFLEALGEGDAKTALRYVDDGAAKTIRGSLAPDKTLRAAKDRVSDIKVTDLGGGEVKASWKAAGATVEGEWGTETADDGRLILVTGNGDNGPDHMFAQLTVGVDGAKTGDFVVPGTYAGDVKTAWVSVHAETTFKGYGYASDLKLSDGKVTDRAALADAFKPVMASALKDRISEMDLKYGAPEASAITMTVTDARFADGAALLAVKANGTFHLEGAKTDPMTFGGPNDLPGWYVIPTDEFLAGNYRSLSIIDKDPSTLKASDIRDRDVWPKAVYGTSITT